MKVGLTSLIDTSKNKYSIREMEGVNIFYYRGFSKDYKNGNDYFSPDINCHLVI